MKSWKDFRERHLGTKAVIRNYLYIPSLNGQTVMISGITNHSVPDSIAYALIVKTPSGSMFGLDPKNVYISPQYHEQYNKA